MKMRTHDNRLWRLISNFRLHSEQVAGGDTGDAARATNSREHNTQRSPVTSKEPPSYDKEAVLIVPHHRSYLFLCRFDRAVSVSAPFFVHFLIGVTVIQYGNYGRRACRSFTKMSKSEQKQAKRCKSEQNVARVSKALQE